MTSVRLAFTCALAASAAAAQQVGPKTHRLDPSPTTVAWGHYDAAAKPALRIEVNGDTELIG